MWGSTNRRIEVIKQDPSSEITNTKKAGRVAQVIQGLPSKHKAQSSTSQYHKKKKTGEFGYLFLPRFMVQYCLVHARR
jgi:hypothetical protein